MSGQFHASRLHEHTLPTPMMDRLDPTGGLTCLPLHLADIFTGGQGYELCWTWTWCHMLHGMSLPAVLLPGVS
jgi:hypothetical protein